MKRAIVIISILISLFGIAYGLGVVSPITTNPESLQDIDYGTISSDSGTNGGTNNIIDSEGSDLSDLSDLSGGLGGSNPVDSILYSGPLPLNLSQNSELIKDELTELGHTDGVSCIESGNIFEISCNDSAGYATYWFCNNTVVESFGEYNDLLTSYNIPSNSCSNNVCYLEIEGVNNPPKNIGSSSDFLNYTYS